MSNSQCPPSTIWYELHAREWPFKTQPAEAIIWQVGRGMKPNLSQIGMGKEISVRAVGPWLGVHGLGHGWGNLGKTFWIC